LNKKYIYILKRIKIIHKNILAVYQIFNQWDWEFDTLYLSNHIYF